MLLHEAECHGCREVCGGLGIGGGSDVLAEERGQGLDHRPHGIFRVRQIQAEVLAFRLGQFHGEYRVAAVDVEVAGIGDGGLRGVDGDEMAFAVGVFAGQGCCGDEYAVGDGIDRDGHGHGLGGAGFNHERAREGVGAHQHGAHREGLVGGVHV